ncbi:MAG: HD domain-containing protein [Spirochaetaceae bacterium]|jgi:GTP pyrophosphokinase|nr:HD domain-containing protein [Spirochaetaceae bacterium]
MDTASAAFTEQICLYDPKAQSRIQEALQWLQGLTGDPPAGEPGLGCALDRATILMKLKADADAVIAALLLSGAGRGFVQAKPTAGDTPEGVKPLFTVKTIRERFGPMIALLVEGVIRIRDIYAVQYTQAEADRIRKMFFAMAKDIRVILIKLADTLCSMRTLERLPRERQRLAAQECLDIYAPLADRLGIFWIKAELEDLSLKHLNREVYQQIKEIVALKRGARQQFLDTVRERLLTEAEAMGMQIQVESRAKHFYSIYHKMRKRHKEAEEIYDFFGIRILCDTVEQCYTLLGLVHRLWKPLEGRFKDYIAMPKSNGYQSLHTTVMAFAGWPEGKLLEIQIRTGEMHHIAEYGVASHWLYKNAASREGVRPLDISLVNRLREWSRDSEGRESLRFDPFIETIKQELLKDSIYLFTPQGQVIELPLGATAIDFAYHIHSAIGDHCLAAKADGVVIPLSAELKNTQVVEILTSSEAHPHLKWLRLVKTAKARSRIRAWLQQHDDSLIIARNVVAKNKIPRDRSKERPSKPSAPEQDPPPVQWFLPPAPEDSPLTVRVEDEQNLMIRFAQCCRPVTGDPIVGYVSRGRGIIIHRKQCRNLVNLPDFEERKIPAVWENADPVLVKRFKVESRLKADLFSEIEGAARKYQGHLIEGRLEETAVNRLTGFFTLQLQQAEDVKKIMKNIRGIPEVFTIQMV